MARSLNKVQLIGNLTRDPEMRYTPSGTAVCTFTVATNRQWKTESGDTRDDAEFHRIVSWDKLAEICNQYLKKGRQVFVEGRLQTRKWEGKDGKTNYTTEIVINEMIMLGGRGGENADYGDEGNINDIPDDFEKEMNAENKPEKEDKKEKGKKKASKKENPPAGGDEDDDIPF